MDHDRWTLVEELFEAARARPAAERRAYLERRCGSDAELLAEVVSLLAQDDTDPDFLAEPIADVAGAVLSEPREPMPERVGPYRVLRPLGRGGMGQVYLAARDDGTFEGRVALKVIRRGLDTDDLLARFRAERRILASLKHPHIATVLDAGALADGRPYLVMELVEGRPITRYCDEERLPLRERLELFRTVCDAVQHAHGRLIVHRDLKPGNILVSGDGIPKLLDFGVAKLLDPAGSGFTAPLTRTDVRVLTPQYAAPEQVLDGDVTTATDVYALGMLLYELLTGRPPYTVRGGSRSEIERAVLDTRPERPSRAGASADDRRLTDARRLRGDLDNIVLKALEKEPALRYGSAEQLAADLERHVRGLPVHARPATLSYRARKFVSRNRWTVAAAAAFVVLLTGFSTFSAVQATRIRRQAAEVTRERDRGRRTLGFMQELFRASDPFNRGSDAVTVRELLDGGADRIAGGLEDEPETRADLMMVMGEAYRGLGLRDRAQELAREALRIRRELPDAGGDVAESLNLLGHLAAERGERDAAEELYREALEIRRRLMGKHPLVASTTSNLALALHEAGDAERAEPLFREALELERSLGSAADSSRAYTTNNYAILLRTQGRYQEAEALYRESLEVRHRLYGEHHPMVATASMNLGRLLRDLGRLAEAEEMLRRSLAADLAVLGERHPYVLGDRSNLGGLLFDLGRLAEADTLLRSTLADQVEVHGPDHPDVAFTALRLGRVLHAVGRYGEAESHYIRALEIVRSRFGDEHPVALSALSDLGVLRIELGDLAGAEAAAREAHAGAEAGLPPGHPTRLAIGVRLARVLAARMGRGLATGPVGRVDGPIRPATADPDDRAAGLREAELLLRQVVQAARSTTPAGHFFVAGTEALLGQVLLLSGRPEAAEQLVRSAIADLEASLGPGHPTTAESRWRLAEILEALGRTREARSEAALAARHLDAILGSDHRLSREAGDTYRRLADPG